MAMSFFSTSDILKSSMTKELINSVVECDEFKEVLAEFDFDKCFSKELVEQVIDNLFLNSNVRKQMRKIILEILSDLGVKDEVITKINNDSETLK